MGSRSEAVRLRAFVKDHRRLRMRLIETGPVPRFVEGNGPHSYSKQAVKQLAHAADSRHRYRWLLASTPTSAAFLRNRIRISEAPRVTLADFDTDIAA